MHANEIHFITYQCMDMEHFSLYSNTYKITLILQLTFLSFNY
jgi:hypothetical protein